MRDFLCPTCGQHLTFENSVCLSCGGRVGFSVADTALLVLADPAGARSGIASSAEYRMCANLHLAECNWLVRIDDDTELCASCRLTRTRPPDDDAPALAAFAAAESAKRRLVAELHELGLPIVGRDTDPEFGLAFDLLSSRAQPVTTGHKNGVITLDLAEGDDIHREQLRIAMDEPYRTLLGHFRHEISHYYFYRLIAPAPTYLDRFGALFGDPNADYGAALDRHYTDGPRPGWEDAFVSSYAAAHPAEDWAETFAHYLHIRDTLDTCAAFGFAPAAAAFERPPLGPSAFDTLIELWLPLAWALNMQSRAMGKPDLYPFVLPPAVLDKMRFIHTVIDETASDSRIGNSVSTH
ncbi:zinc-binding metallopeptidase family protein [Nocardia stercoris]|uniref:Zinc-ribbon domain-containing protein n=1 Tax=Nocardia stercoris TaxID=2483361 RepID=A0A3M2KTF5_9NOCA|nr:putative zinc-binding metallopeptidase [Nocardia stercoris]RMI27750.1 hypothetical protein EBN03_32995 [Nocardia stercoris]